MFKYSERVSTFPLTARRRGCGFLKYESFTYIGLKVGTLIVICSTIYVQSGRPQLDRSCSVVRMMTSTSLLKTCKDLA